MAIERWDPFREGVSLRDAVNSLLQESFVRPGDRRPRHIAPGCRRDGDRVRHQGVIAGHRARRTCGSPSTAAR